MIDQLDGRIGESWSGEVPNGSHINVVLARRGSPTAAAAAGALAGPRPGHLPFLACLSPGVLVRPATIVVNKSPIEGDGAIGPITWGAAQLGIAQGVLDAVADGVIEGTGDLLVLVAVWVDPRAEDETAVREANRESVRRAVGMCVEGHDATAVAGLVARRDEITSPFYGGS